MRGPGTVDEVVVTIAYEGALPRPRRARLLLEERDDHPLRGCSRCDAGIEVGSLIFDDGALTAFELGPAIPSTSGDRRLKATPLDEAASTGSN